MVAALALTVKFRFIQNALCRGGFHERLTSDGEIGHGHCVSAEKARHVATSVAQRHHGAVGVIGLRFPAAILVVGLYNEKCKNIYGN